mmetsp:Transcript_7920/g.11838  ORF Transcript_7920/g.11838 Transcript_7920/m.11838 type:complete len:370 (+) Transcript_7920:22-1131(+)
MEISILQPDDFHHHFRDGKDVLRDVTTAVFKSLHSVENVRFGRVLAMPNLKPPVRNLKEAISYKERILSNIPPELLRNYTDILMTLYLTDSTTPEDIIAAKQSGIVYAAKLYPAGATTNSELGVTVISNISSVLQAMSDVGMPLLVHGEVVDKDVDIFDREKVFIDSILRPIVLSYPFLKIVMEHITTEEAVNFIFECSLPRVQQGQQLSVAATITAHHLLYNRNDLFKGGVCPHMYCLPVLKRERHRQALLRAATSGQPFFFIGTDSAPHSVSAKESSCGCAGIFNAHAAVELYAEAFASVQSLDKLEGFTSVFGQQFYGLKVHSHRILLKQESWLVPETFAFGKSNEGTKVTVRPLRAGEEVLWKIV